MQLKDRIKWKILRSWWRAKSYVHTVYHFFNRGYSCEECGKKYSLAGYNVEGVVNDKRMIFSHTSKQNICPHCLSQKIEQFFLFAKAGNNKHDGVYWGECEFTGKRAKVMRISPYTSGTLSPGLNIRFGSNYWNGSVACSDAFRILLTEAGTMVTPYHAGKRGYCQDKNGVRAKPQHVKDIK